jgi:integrase
MERYLSDWLDRPLRSITWDLVEERHRDIQAEIEQRRQHRHPAHFGSRPGAAQANLVMVILRALWNFALYLDRDSELPANPVRLKIQCHKEPRRERIVRGDDFPAFYRAISGLSNPIMADYIKLLLFTGLRRTEAAGLRWDEVDFATRVITLGAKRTKADRKLALPMSSFVRDLLVARRAIGDTGWVFPANSKSGHLEEPAFAFDEIAAASGIQVSAHDLRRTFITIAEGTDISPMALRRWLITHSVTMSLLVIFK